MDVTLLIARLVLVGIFMVAGIAKLFDLKGSQMAMRGFGVSEAFAKPFGLLLPIVELLVALLLLPVATAWWGAMAALGLLLAFLAGISYNLILGRTPDCHCFGQLHSAPVGWATILRNSLLVAVAGFIIWQGHKNPGLSLLSVWQQLSLFQIVVLVIGLVLGAIQCVQGWFLLNLLQQNGRLLLRIDALEQRSAPEAPAVAAPKPDAPGLPIGTMAPSFSLPGLYGETLTLDSLQAAGKPVLLIFSSPQCVACNMLMPEIAAWQRDYTHQLTTVLISRGTREANLAKQREYQLNQILIQPDLAISKAYQSNATPTAVLIDSSGRIASFLAVGAAEISALVKQQIQPLLPNQGIQPENNACATASKRDLQNAPLEIKPVPVAMVPEDRHVPALHLPDLNGRQVDLSRLMGRQRLLLFWNPACGYCSRMLPALKQWEADRPVHAPELVLISTGSVAENRAMGLKSMILLDQGFQLGRALMVQGTPSALLIDPEGQVASQVAVGADQVLALADSGVATYN